jgi:hypothetical protein
MDSAKNAQIDAAMAQLDIQETLKPAAEFNLLFIN